MAQGYKTGGRKKGTPNKTTAEIREMLTKLISKEIEQVPELLSKIENPEQRLNCIIKLLPYVTPKFNSIDHNIADSNEVRAITLNID